MERIAISVRGLVQGVGFRPYVFNLASRFALSGSVTNETDGVLIEVEGEGDAVHRFLDELPRSAPKAARIEALEWDRAPVRGEAGFRIRESESRSTSSPMVLADRATCADCVRELFDPADRRYHYPFLNCTQCGPRLTIIEGAPYDRERTTMARFTMCSRCRAEYENPADRRFHAQPIACPECGPKLSLPLGAFVAKVLEGGIGALKGLGGYHLVCNARSEEAVSRLRTRKRRYEKPFAVMVGTMEVARSLADVSLAEEALLASPRKPIVLLRKRTPFPLADSVAPGNPNLGLLLPYTPLHHLLMDAVSGAPLVMTSGNRSDEPIVHRDEEVGERLSAIADVVLTHDRPIRVRADDSVTRVVLGEETPLRRSRGYAPEPVALKAPLPKKVLAVGAQWKNTFALGSGRHAFLSHHVGDLEDYRAYEAFERDIRLYEELFEFSPDVLVHDLHPDYASTRYARERGDREGLPRIAVQHHHAHVASCMAENGISGPVIGVAFDGTGFGTDGTLWGGEVLVADEAHFERAAHLLPLALPGGDSAAREPWRMAVSYLLASGLDPSGFVDEPGVEIVAEMIRKNVNAPLTSSAGRLFDAVASLLGVRQKTTYEGQAAMELEWLCGDRASGAAYPYSFLENDDALIVDTRPLMRAVVEAKESREDVPEIARRFHQTVSSLIVDCCLRIRDTEGLGRVALSGGVFQNVLLTTSVVPALEERGFQVFRHRKVPPSDGGLALGQLAVAGGLLSCA